jgi:putative oxidoreductase
MAGAFVLAFSLPLAIVMFTAMLTVHLRYGFSSIRLVAVTTSSAQFGPIGYEMNLLYIAGLATLAVGGAGRLSVNGCLETRRRHVSAEALAEQVNEQKTDTMLR